MPANPTPSPLFDRGKGECFKVICAAHYNLPGVGEGQGERLKITLSTLRVCAFAAHCVFGARHSYFGDMLTFFVDDHTIIP